MKKILLTRPQQDAEPLAKKLQQQGYQPMILPMMEVEFLPEIALPVDNIDALIFTSANGVRALMHQLQYQPQYRQQILATPCYAVGAKTASTAKSYGFDKIAIAGGDANKLYQLIIDTNAHASQRFYHVAADNHPHALVERLKQAGLNATRQSFYKTLALQRLPADFTDIFPQINAVMLFSVRTAEIFLELLYNQTLQKEIKYTIKLVCLSNAVRTASQNQLALWQKAGFNVDMHLQVSTDSSDGAMLMTLNNMMNT